MTQRFYAAMSSLAGASAISAQVLYNVLNIKRCVCLHRIQGHRIYKRNHTATEIYMITKTGMKTRIGREKLDTFLKDWGLRVKPRSYS